MTLNADSILFKPRQPSVVACVGVSQAQTYFVREVILLKRRRGEQIIMLGLSSSFMLKGKHFWW
jgi:hypothetical protein